MRIFITGATGLIGSRLVVDRLERGDDVVILSRNGARASKRFAADANPHVTVVEGDVSTPGAWQEHVDGCDAVVHLAGAGIGDKRWTAEYKRELATSRIDSTHQVVNAVEAATRRPQVLICSSAVGLYGDRGDDKLDESAQPATDNFLGELCVRWEEQAERASTFGVRTVRLRTGIVLDNRGGALMQMLPPFRWYVGGPLGNGRQYMPWVHWRDLIGIVDLALRDRTVSGPVNAVSPNPVTNRDFSHELGVAINRPSWIPAPKFALRILLGEFANFLMMSQRVVPARAEQHGYRFHYPNIRGALENLLGNGRRDQQQQTPAEQATAAVANNESVAPTARIRLLAIDVDGTLLRSDGSIAQGVVQACRAAERAGCAIVLATARPPRAMKSILQTLDITGPTINYHGALIWNPVNSTSQFHQPMDVELARRIVECAREKLPEIMVAIEVFDQWFTDRDSRSVDTDAVRLVEPNRIAPLDECLTEPVTKLNLIGSASQIQILLPEIQEKFWKQREVGMFLTDPSLIQLTHPMADKGIALQRIANRMNLNREEVMAIGDGVNDMGMIEWAGFSVAVENAIPSVRSLADVIVPSNDQHGVARAIHRFVLSNL